MIKINIKKIFGTQDMTTGSIWKSLIVFCIPLLVGNIVQQLYSTVDAIVVGTYVGDNALAAVGSSFPIQMIVMVLFMGISTGAGIMVSQYFGAKDRELLSATIGTTIVLMLVSSIVLMALGTVIARPLLTLIRTPDDIYEMCAAYLTILFIGVSGLTFYNGITGILRGMGDSVTPLIFLCITCIMNIFLDIWFVSGLGMGVEGAAWATVISQWISSVLCIVRLFSMRQTFDVSPRRLKPNREICGHIIELGLPAACTQIVFSLANIAVQGLINTFGTLVIACSTIIMRVDGFAMMPNFSFGMVMSTFVGQNIGAGKMDRVDRGTRNGLILGLGVAAALVLGILCFGETLIRFFTQTPELIALSSRMLRVLAVGYLGMGTTQILSGVMRGAGDTTTPLYISIFTTIIVRVPLAYSLARLTRSALYPQGRPEIIYVSLLVAWLMGAGASCVFFRMGKWREKSIVKTDARRTAMVSDGE
jgi:putative MATE family efflux protein